LCDPGARLEAGWLHAAVAASKLITTSDVYVYDALKTPQFCMSQQRQFTTNRSRPRASAAL
jgi:hypothetical protein